MALESELTEEYPIEVGLTLEGAAVVSWALYLFIRSTREPEAFRIAWSVRETLETAFPKQLQREVERIFNLDPDDPELREG